jgi:cell division septation protein DedD
VPVKAEVQPAQEEPTTSNPQGNLTFYKAVQRTGDAAQPPSKEAQSATSTNATEATATPASAAAKSVTAPPSGPLASSPVVTRSSPVTGPGTIVVQIAAVSREDDAVALAGALRKKNYNVFVVNSPVTNDKFYHVQVGPFATIQEADAMKAKLIGEGYSAIVKK